MPFNTEEIGENLEIEIGEKLVDVSTLFDLRRPESKGKGEAKPEETDSLGAASTFSSDGFVVGILN